MSSVYEVIPHIVPIMLLALVFDSHILERVKRRQPSDVRFWTKPRVRVLGMFVLVDSFVVEVVALLVLSSHAIRRTPTIDYLVLAGTLALFGVLLSRIYWDIMDATDTRHDLPVVAVEPEPASWGSEGGQGMQPDATT